LALIAFFIWARRLQILQGLTPELLVVWGLAAVGVYSLLAQIFRRRYQRPFRAYDKTDSADQLRAVMLAEFSARRVMSLAEYRVFKAVEAEVQAIGRGHRVFAQTALGEVIRSADRQAHSAINSKRVDVLVVGPQGLPVAAIEHQGQGHYQGDAAARDAVKKEALRKAGVAYIEIFDHHTPETIRLVVREALIPANRADAVVPLRSTTAR
jgi:hypothetical protein